MFDPTRSRALSKIDLGAPSMPTNHVQHPCDAIGKRVSVLPRDGGGV